MSQTTIKIAIPVALLILILVGYFVLQGEKIEKMPETFRAVPLDAGIVFTSNLPQKVGELHSILYTNPMLQQVREIFGEKGVIKELSFIDSIFNEDETAASIVNSNQIIISFHNKGKGRVDKLFLIGLEKIADSKSVFALFDKYTKKRTEVVERTYNNVKILDAHFANADYNCSFSVSEGILMFSFNPTLVEDAVRQLKSGVSLLENDSFKKLNSIAGKNVQACIYANFKLFPQLFSPILTEETITHIKDLTNFADWTELDMEIKPNGLMLNGFSYSNDSMVHFINCFKNQTTEPFEIDEILPDNTTAFTSFGISNKEFFKRDYKNYLTLADEIHIYNRDCRSVLMEIDIDIEWLFYSMLDNEFGIAYLPQTVGLKQTNKAIFFMKTVSKSQSAEKLKELLTNYAVNNSLRISDLEITSKIDNDKSFTIFKLPVHRIAAKIFGSYFNDVESNYYTFIDNYLIIAPDIEVLEVLMKNFVLKKTLENDVYYESFSNSISKKSNITLYHNIARSINWFSEISNPTYKQFIEENIKLFRSYQAISLQISGGENIYHTDIYLHHAPDYQIESQSVWERKIDTNFVMKPALVKNHNTGEKEIFVQDLNNKIYLINSSGRILWEKKLESEILSPVFQIDFYGNNKLQMLFNTKNKLHLIDREGNNVEKYPITLHSTASNAMNLFQYENSDEGRIIIAGTDRKIYMYSQKGERIAGWNFEGTESLVTNKIQYFNITGKDYIVFADQTRVYIQNRKGETRVKIDGNFSPAKNSEFYLQWVDDIPRWVTTDSDGVVQFIYTSGKTSHLKFHGFSEDHFFKFDDINADGSKEFIFVDNKKLSVYTNSSAKLFNMDFEETITNEPIIFAFSATDIKIGIVSAASNELFLINGNGTFHKGFPVAGSVNFSIGTMKTGTTDMNLITGNKNAFLCNYLISK